MALAQGRLGGQRGVTSPRRFGSAKSRSKARRSCCSPSKASAIPFNSCAMRRSSLALGAKVILGVQPPLKAVCGDYRRGFAWCWAIGEPLPPTSISIARCSACRLAFGTELATMPANIPYIRPDRERLAKWRGKDCRGTAGCASAFAGPAAIPFERPQSLDPARALRHDPVGAGRRFRQPAKGRQRGGGGDLERAWRQSARAGICGFCRHRRRRRDARSRHLRRHLGRASCRRDGQGRRRVAAVLAGFPVAARSHRQSLVSDHAAVPADRDRRLERPARAAASRTDRRRSP